MIRCQEVHLAGLVFTELDAFLAFIGLHIRDHAIEIGAGVFQITYEQMQQLFLDAGKGQLFDALRRVIVHRLEEASDEIYIARYAGDMGKITPAFELWSFLFSVGELPQQALHGSFGFHFVTANSILRVFFPTQVILEMVSYKPLWR